MLLQKGGGWIENVCEVRATLWDDFNKDLRKTWFDEDMRGGPKWEQGYSLEYPLFFTNNFIYVLFLKYMKKKIEK